MTQLDRSRRQTHSDLSFVAPSAERAVIMASNLRDTFSAAARRLLLAGVVFAPAFASEFAAANEAVLRDNIERVIASVEAATGEEVLNALVSEATDDPKIYCLEDRYCEGRIEELRIEAMGRQIEISPSPRTPPETLVNSCIGLLAAFADPNAASEIDDFVHAATAHVLDGERIEIDLGTFEFTMKLTAEDLPSCKVVRFIQQ